ncbi:MAG: hypothetical protein O2887_16940 [Bacteroidetes bacterium]|nr:hypothetical protein [Bacteroidota bacterium]MDA1122147.1 hypothetical protein [Bacteroidota bacterium]
MKNFPLVPVFMISLMAILYFVGLQKGRENQSLIDHGLAVNVDKHLSMANIYLLISII